MAAGDSPLVFAGSIRGGGIRMKGKDQIALGDGFDKNVAEKMPKIKKLEDPAPFEVEDEVPPPAEEIREFHQEARVAEKPAVERKILFRPPPEGAEAEPFDVLKLLEDLHAQVLASGRIKRALETDLASSQKTIHQLAMDNKVLRAELGEGRKQLQKIREIQTESLYLKEENEDALEKIRQLMDERRGINEALAAAIRERDEVRNRVQELESRVQQNELLRIKEKMKEREASQFYDENREIRSKLDEALARNADLEKRYGTLRKSFDEVKESLSLLRESCKASYYNLSDSSE
jgi:hypothetical protein